MTSMNMTMIDDRELKGLQEKARLWDKVKEIEENACIVGLENVKCPIERYCDRRRRCMMDILVEALEVKDV